MQGTIIILSILALSYLYSKYKEGIQQEILIAFTISLVWVKYSGIYNYGSNYILFGINLFPLIAWTTGLVILREIYEKMKGKNKFYVASGLYIVLLLILEWVGYNVWDIQLASNFPGLLGFELMHMPSFGQMFYLTIGPVYLLITDYLNVK